MLSYFRREIAAVELYELAAQQLALILKRRPRQTNNYAQLDVDDVINLQWSMLQVQIRFRIPEETKTMWWHMASRQKLPRD